MKKNRGILLSRPRVSWNKCAWISMPKPCKSENDKAEIHPAGKVTKATLAGKERATRSTKIHSSGTRVIKRDLMKSKFYGE